jgi:hypothetical protein
MAGKPETRELAHEAIGSARVTAFGVSNVAPAGAVAGGLVIVGGALGGAGTGAAVALAGVPAPGRAASHPVTGEVPELPVRHDVNMDKSLSSYRLPFPTCRLWLEGGVP